MLGRLRSAEPVLPIAVIDAELATLNEAIERVEALFAESGAPAREGVRNESGAASGGGSSDWRWRSW